MDRLLVTGINNRRPGDTQSLHCMLEQWKKKWNVMIRFHLYLACIFGKPQSTVSVERSIFHHLHLWKKWWLFSLKTTYSTTHSSKGVKMFSRQRVTISFYINLMFPLLWPVVDNYLAEVSRPHLPILSLRHQRNRDDPYRALPARWEPVGGGGWGRHRGGHTWGHWTDCKGNGCPEEGIWIHLCVFVVCFSHTSHAVGLLVCLPFWSRMK